MAKLVNVAVSEAVGVQSLRVRVSLRAHLNFKPANIDLQAFVIISQFKTKAHDQIKQ